MVGTATINLPLKTYLVKYLQKHFGEEYVVGRESWLGIYLIAVLDKDFKTSQENSFKECSSYKIVIPQTLVLSKGFSVSTQKYKQLQNLVHKVFSRELCNYVEISMVNELKVTDKKHDSVIKQNRQRAIKQFLEFYNIGEDDLKFESVYRRYK